MDVIKEGGKDKGGSGFGEVVVEELLGEVRRCRRCWFTVH